MTDVPRNANGTFAKGNPGRRPGQTNRVGRQLTQFVLDHFAAHRVNFLDHLIHEDPRGYLMLLRMVLPRASGYADMEAAELPYDPAAEYAYGMRRMAVRISSEQANWTEAAAFSAWKKPAPDAEGDALKPPHEAPLAAAAQALAPDVAGLNDAAGAAEDEDSVEDGAGAGAPLGSRAGQGARSPLSRVKLPEAGAKPQRQVAIFSSEPLTMEEWKQKHAALLGPDGGRPPGSGRAPPNPEPAAEAPGGAEAMPWPEPEEDDQARKAREAAEWARKNREHQRWREEWGG